MAVASIARAPEGTVHTGIKQKSAVQCGGVLIVLVSRVQEDIFTVTVHTEPSGWRERVVYKLLYKDWKIWKSMID